MKKNLMGRVVRHAVTLFLCAVMLVVAPVSYAWFTSLWESGPDRIHFSTGAVEYPPILMWTYLTEEEAGESGTPGWTLVDLTEDEDTPGKNVAPAIELNESGEEFVYSLPSLQIGTVDNVLTVKNDNILYFRIEVDRSRFGDTVTLALGPAEATDYAFELYNGQGLEDGHVRPVPAEGYVAMQSVLDGTYDPKNNPGTRSVFAYGSCISSEKLTPSDADFAKLEFQDGQSTVTNTDTDTDTYYLYLRIMPDLQTFLLLAKALALYMPCLILCDEEISVSFENYVTGN